ncbi:MAG: hypothetical protein RLZZ156_2348 [Deinococcota bacterium]|jgi:hypothetical protein
MMYQDQFIEAALEEFIIIELNFEQEYGLGTAFYNAMQSAVQGLLEFPEMMQKVHKSGMRRISVTGFPVNIFYRLEQESVVIYAVAHQSRKPFYWVKRVTK